MWGIRFTRSKLYAFSVFACAHLKEVHLKPTRYQNPIFETAGTTTKSIAITNPLNFCFSFQLSSFGTSNIDFPREPKVESFDENSDNDNDGGENSDDFDGNSVNGLSLSHGVAPDVKKIMDLIHETGRNFLELKNKLEQCDVRVSSELVVEVLSQVRHDWEAAFTFFLWAGKQPEYALSLREYHSMISILAKMRKFDTAWTLIDEMRGGRAGPCLVTPQTLLIMIRRYCAVHDVGRAINTFYAYKKFKFDVGIEEFHSLLSALCRYKNVQDAEHLMFCNKDVFPFNTKSFNIILNGWCNVIGSPREAERVWTEMSKRGVRYDVVSYASIMSCYSKSSNLNKVLKLFTQMKSRGIEPDRKVYNAVIHALAKARHVKEAINLLKVMEENGIAPNVVTYNSLIKPLCKAQKIDEARQVLDEMLQKGLSPTFQTYHAFFRILRTGEEVFELLNKMRKMGCQPTNDTYIMLIRKFSRWCHFDNVFKLWNEMIENGVGPDRSSYIVLIHGLFLNGKLDEAYKYYMEMKEKQFLPEPKIDEMLQSWVSGKQFAELQVTDLKNNQLLDNQLNNRNRVQSRKLNQEKDFLKEPETRRVVRERGRTKSQGSHNQVKRCFSRYLSTIEVNKLPSTWKVMEVEALNSQSPNSNTSFKSKDCSMRLDDWVLCRIYKKSHALSSTSAAENDRVQEEDEAEQFIQDALLPALESPSTNNNNAISLHPQKSCSFSNLLDATDYSMLSSFLADNQCNTTGFESPSFGFRNIEQPPAVGGDSRLLQKLPQLNSSVPSMGNKFKRQYSSIDEDYLESSKKHIGSCSNTKSTSQPDMTQYNLLNQQFLNHNLLLNHHFQFQG
ncbi:hypothetical protein GQ457_11G015020 [Hibiscus cannabinus]